MRRSAVRSRSAPPTSWSTRRNPLAHLWHTGGSAMATTRKRGQRWHVQIRRKGRPSVTRSFLVKSDADAWARQQELEADRFGLPPAHKGLRGLKVCVKLFPRNG